jgi:hypothetical protein
MFEVYYRSPADPDKEKALTKLVAAFGGRLDYREMPQSEANGSICLTFEFDGHEEADKAASALRQHGEHVEGPIEYGPTRIQSGKSTGDNTKCPKIFITYSWTSDDHVEWVIKLAERLLGDGVDVVLDQWDLKEGHDKYAFMEQMVTDPTVTRVLAICDKVYAEKANERRGGVGTESQIISREVYEKVIQEKFVALVREKDDSGAPYLPVFFRSRIYIDFCSEEGFEEAYDQLLRCLFGRPERKKPPLGDPPPYLFKEEVTHVKTAGRFQRLKDAVDKSKPYVDALLNDYLESFLNALRDFRISCDGPAESEFDEKVLASVTSFLPYRDSFLEFADFVARFMDREHTYDAVFDFFESLLPFKERPVTENSWYEPSTDNYRFIAYELFLYWLATLIQNKRYTAATRFIEDTYHYTEYFGGGRWIAKGVSAFNCRIWSLDEYRNTHRNLNTLSVTAVELKQRAKGPKVSFRDLCQIDLILFIRPFFPEPGAAGDWWPCLLPYVYNDYVGWGAFELFAKAGSKRGLIPLQHLLKVKSLPDLVGQFETMFQNQVYQRLVGHYRWRVDIAQLVNFNELESAVSRRI